MPPFIHSLVRALAFITIILSSSFVEAKILPQAGETVSVGDESVRFDSRLAEVNEKYAFLWHWMKMPQCREFSAQILQTPEFKDFVYPGDAGGNKLKKPITKDKASDGLSEEKASHFISEDLLKGEALAGLFQKAQTLFCAKYPDDPYCTQISQQDKIWEDRLTSYLGNIEPEKVSDRKQLNRDASHIYLATERLVSQCQEAGEGTPAKQRCIHNLVQAMNRISHHVTGLQPEIPPSADPNTADSNLTAALRAEFKSKKGTPVLPMLMPPEISDSPDLEAEKNSKLPKINPAHAEIYGIRLDGLYSRAKQVRNDDERKKVLSDLDQLNRSYRIRLGVSASRAEKRTQAEQTRNLLNTTALHSITRTQNPPPVSIQSVPVISAPLTTPETVASAIRRNPFSNAAKLLPSAPPVSGVSANGRAFYLSDIFHESSGERDYAVMYAQNETGQFVPRILYKSKSDGTWRSAPTIMPTGYLSKGRGVHYTQETKLHADITSHLEGRTSHKTVTPAQKKDLTAHFSPDKLGAIDTFQHESTIYNDGGKFKPLQACQPGLCWNSCIPDVCTRGSENRFERYFGEVDKLFAKPEMKDFMPDFSRRPEKVYQMSHTLLSAQGTDGRLKSDITVKVFHGKLDGRTVEWHMARDKDGRVWIDRIRFRSGKTNTYGTEEEVINSGILTNKPLEYHDQARALSDAEKKSFDGTYTDISPVLKNLLPIRKFMEAEGIPVGRTGAGG